MSENPKKILVIQLKRIGDVVLAVPVVEIIKKKYPEAKIDFLVENPASEVLENNPNINKVHIYEKEKPLKWILKIRREKYDWVIDFLGNPRSELITALSKAKIKAGPANVFWKLGYNTILTEIKTSCYAAIEKIKMLSKIGINFENDKILPKIYLTDAELSNAKTYASKEEFLIGFSPTSRKITRRYPKNNWVELARLLTKNINCKIVVFWGPGEKEYAEDIVNEINSEKAVLASKTSSLRELAAVLTKFNILISNCNGTKHIATAVNTSTLTIHGSSSSVCWTPSGYEQHQYIKNTALKCLPCAKNICPKNIECLKELKPEAVYKKAVEMLRN